MKLRHYPSSPNLLFMALIMIMTPMIGGCSQTASFMSETQSVAADGTVTNNEPLQGYTQIPDLPFPVGSKMNIERTFIVGSGESWYGQILIEAPSDANNSFDFYKQKLNEYGWNELSSVRAQTSILTYMRENRILVIQISQPRIGKTEIMITVSPKEGGGVNG